MAQIGEESEVRAPALTIEQEKDRAKRTLRQWEQIIRQEVNPSVPIIAIIITIVLQTIKRRYANNSRYNQYMYRENIYLAERLKGMN